MKRRIGSLRGKPIVEGDENLLTQNELHEDNLNSNNDSNGGGSNGGSSIEGLLENSYKTMVIDFDVWEATPYGSQKEHLPYSIISNCRTKNTGEDLGSQLSYLYDKTNANEEGTFEAIHPMYFIKDGVCERVESVTVSSELNNSDYVTYYRYTIYTKSYRFNITEEVQGLSFTCGNREQQ